MEIAVDAMGGDGAPDVEVQGALEAVRELGVRIRLVGNKELLEKALGSHKNEKSLTIHHCDEWVRMDEAPLKAVRKKKDASIRVAFDLAKKKEVAAVVSAGNSGATMAAGVLALGRMEGAERPAIASVFPGKRGPVVLIDVGANVDCRPRHLFQFGIMAHAFASVCLGVKDPKIGLLSIGEEGSKGNEQVRLTHQLFESSNLNFSGNVEGRDIFAGEVDIIVCDGFVGNVALKLTEGMAETFAMMLQQEMTRSLAGKAALFLGRRSLMRLAGKLDYAEYGGAPLLGVNGVGIICHGSSPPKAIKNAIKLAARYAENDTLEKMATLLQKNKEE
jgi:glycerol-3-phosphate acyltransferase PlsX